jgi:hypothetical protein
MVVSDTPEKVKAMTEGQWIALWTSDIHRAREVLAGLEGILELQTYGDQLRIAIGAFSHDADSLMEDIRSTLTAAKIEVRDMRKTRPRMEEAFISLIRRHMANDEQGDS